MEDDGSTYRLKMCNLLPESERLSEPVKMPGNLQTQHTATSSMPDLPDTSQAHDRAHACMRLHTHVHAEYVQLPVHCTPIPQDFLLRELRVVLDSIINDENSIAGGALPASGADGGHLQAGPAAWVQGGGGGGGVSQVGLGGGVGQACPMCAVLCWCCAASALLAGFCPKPSMGKRL